MQLHSIPPLTMNSLHRRRTSQTMQERAAHLRQNLLALQESLQRIETSRRGGLPLERPPALVSWGGARRNLGATGAPGLGPRQEYSPPAKSHRAIDLLIPSRPAANLKPTEHSIMQTDQACVVHITFPVPVQPNEIRWERQGDVLEVEYLGAAFTYYHAFMVPCEGEPLLSQEDRTLTFTFPAKGLKADG